jgi:hypothetical protein
MEDFEIIAGKLNGAEHVRILQMNEDSLRFVFMQHAKQTDELILELGFKKISQTYFKHTIPTVDEIEYAINFIEDELMRYKKLSSKDEVLVCTDRVLTDIISKTTGYKANFTREEIETLFSRYASVSMGEPLSRSALNINADDYALVLILREIMHHLNFTGISLVRIHN